MDDILLLQTIERYLEGKMLPEEKAFFEQHRKNVPEVDQMVVEHTMFIHQMEDFAANHKLKHSLHLAHEKLLANGDINEGGELTTKAKVVRMWAKYRKVTAIAAVVGGVIAFAISGLVAFFAPAVNDSKIQELNGEVQKLKTTQKVQDNKINEVSSQVQLLPKDLVFTASGTGFLIDTKGYIVTNAHVLKGSSFANVINSKGEQLTAKIIYSDLERDLTLLKISDDHFKPLKNLPYSIRKTNVDLGEEIFTLGFPRNEIVSTIGYLSARTGFNGDTTSFQIQMSAYPGNSGGPVLNKNGEIIGVLSKREKQVEGVAFAIKSKNIYRLINEAEAADEAQKIKMPTASSLRGADRVSQIKAVEDCIFLIQAYNKNK